MTLEHIVRKDVRSHYVIQEHFRRQLTDLGRADILERHALAVEQTADDLGQRAKVHDKAIAAIEDQATGVIRAAEAQREKDAQSYPIAARRSI
jgi:hypothetical protein